ncbi:hypothetical protein ZOSMA_5G01850 [Zostera marina]|uniref:Uncharacterized protein n=1 Tax=Zostera marina TaxID=29655 RepID=A0A0K9NUK9_ZOSMR|nr:hypothetical protein ZOSMA_5G01850 [Zostera marina]
MEVDLFCCVVGFLIPSDVIYTH